MKLTKAQKDGIRRWLDLDTPEERCPFADASGYRADHARECTDVCPVIFPGLDKKRGPSPNVFCPCHYYSLAYVRRVARRVTA